MKKMMLMAVVVLAAVVSQAVGMQWSVGGLADYAGATAYLINEETATRASFTELLDAGKSEEALAAIPGAAWGNTLEIGTGSASTLASAKTGVTVDAGYTASAFAAIVFDDSGTTKIAFTAAKEVKAPNLGNMVFAFGDVSNAITWTTVGGGGGGGDDPIIPDIPEPTSMALVALGAAAFGLRRKLRK